jgi:hypothetical protein
MGIESALSIGGSLVGGIMGQDAAGDAVDAQLDAERMSTEEQRRQFDTIRRDNKLPMQARDAGINQLMFDMGLGGNTSPVSTREQIYNQLLPQYQQSVSGGGGATSIADIMAGLRGVNPMDILGNMNRPGGKTFTSDNGNSNRPSVGPARSRMETDFTGLNAAVEARLREQQAQQSAMQNRPGFGSLMREYGADEFFADDGTQLGLQFGLDEGRKALNRNAAATGSRDSGLLAKALTRFGTDYTSTKFGEGFNRDQAKKSTRFNMLSGLTGMGQVGANQVATSGMNMANNVSQNMIGAGNARAASAIGGANSFSNGIAGAVNGYQQNQLMNRIFQPRASFGSMGMNGFGDSFSTSFGE